MEPSGTEEIIISDAFRRLQEEIAQLRIVVAALMSERDDLQYHICPELSARYAEFIGNPRNRLHYQEIMIRELKRRIELVQAAINRERAISKAEMDQKVEKEYQKFRDAVDEESRQYEETQRKHREYKKKARASEERWREKYGSRSNTDRNRNAHTDGERTAGANRKNTEDTPGSDEATEDHCYDTDESMDTGTESSCPKANSAVPDLKELYRKIVRRLHPDGNPDITEREKELFYRAVQAYQDGDLETLQEIYDEVLGDAMADSIQQEFTNEELATLRNQLQTRIESLQMEIASIKTTFPYTEREFLNDDDAVAQAQARLEEQIHQYEETIQQLNQMLDDLTNEMQNLKKH